MNENYEDLLLLPHPTSKRHRRMSMEERAAQFSPFAALTGYGAAVHETARLTDGKIELTEEERLALDQKLALLREIGGEHPAVTVTYFVPDKNKEKGGGSYASAAGTVKKLDPIGRTLTLSDNIRIPLDDILDIDSDLSLF